MSSTLFIPVSAFLLGLVGSVHCAMMCSGFAATLQRSHQIPGNPSALRVNVAFNAGRLLSYTAAGVISSLFGITIVQILGQHVSHGFMQLFVGGFLMMLGLSIAGWWSGLGWVEKGGQHFWRLLSPLTKYVFPVKSFFQALAAGALWGWLPCGLVYSALVLVMGAGQPLIGALSMLLFGVGTMPMIGAIGLVSAKTNLSEKPLLKKVIGASIMMLGTFMFAGFAMSGMAQH